MKPRGLKSLEKRIWVNELKSHLGCYICKTDNPIVLQFHHLSDKDHSISRMISSGLSLSRIIKEITRCACVCSNHHILIHNESSLIEIDDDEKARVVIPNFLMEKAYDQSLIKRDKSRPKTS